MRTLFSLLLTIVLASCASNKPKSSADSTSRETKTWLIDEPLFPGYSDSRALDEKVVKSYQSILAKNRSAKVKSMASVGLPTLKNASNQNLSGLVFYQEKSQSDYLVETKVEVVKFNKEQLKQKGEVKGYAEFVVTLKVYDLHAKKMVYDHSDTYTNQDPEYDASQDSDWNVALGEIAGYDSSLVAIRDALRGSLSASIQTMASDFQNKTN